MIKEHVENGYSDQRRGWSDKIIEDFCVPAVRRIGFSECVLMKGSKWKAADLKYGADALLTTDKGADKWCAFRVRGSSFFEVDGLREVTIRNESLITSGKKLESEKTKADYLFYAVADSDRGHPATGLLRWHLVSLQEALVLYRRGKLYGDEKCNRDGSSSFLIFAVEDLRKFGLIVAEG